MRRHAVLLSLALVAPAGGAVRAQLRITGSAEASQVEHRVNAGFGVEQSSGTIFGGHGALGFGPRLEIGVRASSGTLTADSVGADDLDFARGGVYAAVFAVPWLALRAEVGVHTLSTPVAVQRWTTGRMGAEARAPMLDGRFHAIGRLELFPLISVSGIEKPNRAFGAAAGVQWSAGPVSAQLLYALERYDFPQSGGVERREQLSFLTGRLSVRVGRSASAPANAPQGGTP